MIISINNDYYLSSIPNKLAIIIIIIIIIMTVLVFLIVYVIPYRFYAMVILVRCNSLL